MEPQTTQGSAVSISLQHSYVFADQYPECSQTNSLDQQRPSCSASHTTSVVYVVEDSVTFGRDWPTVRKALRALRDEPVTADTCMALIMTGPTPTVLFPLTDHATPPWHAELSGYSGPKAYLNGLNAVSAFRGIVASMDPQRAVDAAKDMFIADSAKTKKIVYMTDGRLLAPDTLIDEMVDADIIVDTIFYTTPHTHRSVVVTGPVSAQIPYYVSLAEGTNGEYRLVLAEIVGTKHSPVEPRHSLSMLLQQLAEADVATLYLYDDSTSSTNRKRPNVSN